MLSSTIRINVASRIFSNTINRLPVGIIHRNYHTALPIYSFQSHIRNFIRSNFFLFSSPSSTTPHQEIYPTNADKNYENSLFKFSPIQGEINNKTPQEQEFKTKDDLAGGRTYEEETAEPTEGSYSKTGKGRPWEQAKDEAKAEAGKVFNSPINKATDSSNQVRPSQQEKVKEKAKQTVNDAKETMHEAKGSAQNAAHNQKENVKGKAEEVTRNLKEGAQNLKEKAKDAALGAKESVENATQSAKQSAQNLKDKAQESAQNLKEKAEETAQNAKVGAKGTAQNAKNTVDQTTDKAQNVAQGVKEKTQDVVQGVKEKTQDVVQGVKEKTQDIAQDLKEKAQDASQTAWEGAKGVAATTGITAGIATETVKGAWEKVKETAKQAQELLTGKEEENPSKNFEDNNKNTNTKKND